MRTRWHPTVRCQLLGHRWEENPRGSNLYSCQRCQCSQEEAATGFGQDARKTGTRNTIILIGLTIAAWAVLIGIVALLVLLVEGGGVL